MNDPQNHAVFTGRPKGGSELLACNNCEAAVDICQPVFTCVECLPMDNSPSNGDFLCAACRAIHAVAHAR